MFSLKNSALALSRSAGESSFPLLIMDGVEHTIHSSGESLPLSVIIPMFLPSITSESRLFASDEVMLLAYLRVPYAR